MTNEDKAWEQFSKADANSIADASAQGMLQAIMAELNSVKADTARLAAGASAAPPVDETADAIPPMPPEMGGDMAGMPPAEGEGEMVPPMEGAPMEGAPMEPPVEGGAPMPEGADGVAQSPLEEDDLFNFLMEGAQEGEAPEEGAAPIEEAPVEEDVSEVDETLSALQDALSRAKDPEVIANLAKIIQDYVQGGGSEPGPIADEAPMPEMPGPMPAEMPPEIPPEAVMDAIPPEVVEKLLGEEGSVAGEEANVGEDALLEAALGEPVMKAEVEGYAPEQTTENIGAGAEGGDAVGGGAVEGDAAPDEGNADSMSAPADESGEGGSIKESEGCGMEKGDDESAAIVIKIFLGTTMDDTFKANADRGISDKDLGENTESFKVCNDITKSNPVRFGIEDVMNQRLREKSGVDGKRYQVKKSATEIRAERYQSIVKSIGSYKTAAPMRVGDVLCTLNGLKRMGMPDVERSFAPLIDEIVKYCDNVIDPRYTAPIFKSFSLDLGEIYQPLDTSSFRRAQKRLGTSLGHVGAGSGLPSQYIDYVRSMIPQLIIENLSRMYPTRYYSPMDFANAYMGNVMRLGSDGEATDEPIGSWDEAQKMLNDKENLTPEQIADVQKEVDSVLYKLGRSAVGQTLGGDLGKIRAGEEVNGEWTPYEIGDDRLSRLYNDVGKSIMGSEGITIPMDTLDLAGTYGDLNTVPMMETATHLANLLGIAKNNAPEALKALILGSGTERGKGYTRGTEEEFMNDAIVNMLMQTALNGVEGGYLDGEGKVKTAPEGVDPTIWGSFAQLAKDRGEKAVTPLWLLAHSGQEGKSALNGLYEATKGDDAFMVDKTGDDGTTTRSHMFEGSHPSQAQALTNIAKFLRMVSDENTYNGMNSSTKRFIGNLGGRENLLAYPFTKRMLELTAKDDDKSSAFESMTNDQRMKEAKNLLELAKFNDKEDEYVNMDDEERKANWKKGRKDLTNRLFTSNIIYPKAYRDYSNSPAVQGLLSKGVMKDITGKGSSYSQFIMDNIELAKYIMALQKANALMPELGEAKYDRKDPKKYLDEGIPVGGAESITTLTPANYAENLGTPISLGDLYTKGSELRGAGISGDTYKEWMKKKSGVNPVSRLEGYYDVFASDKGKGKAEGLLGKEIGAILHGTGGTIDEDSLSHLVRFITDTVGGIAKDDEYARMYPKKKKDKDGGKTPPETPPKTQPETPPEKTVDLTEIMDAEDAPETPSASDESEETPETPSASDKSEEKPAEEESTKKPKENRRGNKKKQDENKSGEAKSPAETPTEGAETSRLRGRYGAKGKVE